MKIEFQYESERSQELLKDMFNIQEQPLLGQKYKVDGNAEFQYIQGLDSNITGVEVLTFILTSAASVSLSVLANYLYDNLKKDKSIKVYIESREITAEDLSPELIEQILKMHQDKYGSKDSE